MPAGRALGASLALSLLCAALSGCFSAKDSNARCSDPSEYQKAGSVTGVVVPEGLAAPGQASSYTVPPAARSQEVAGAACLGRPPDYFRKDPGAVAPPDPAPTEGK